MNRKWHRRKLPKEMGETILWHVLERLQEMAEFEASNTIYNLLRKHFLATSKGKAA